MIENRGVYFKSKPVIISCKIKKLSTTEPTLLCCELRYSIQVATYFYTLWLPHKLTLKAYQYFPANRRAYFGILWQRRSGFIVRTPQLIAYQAR